MTGRSRPAVLAWAAAAFALLLIATAPILASANGSPHLDRTNGGAGTLYNLGVIGAFLSMDPNDSNSSFVNLGTILIFQDAGSSDLDALVLLDTTGDLVPDRTLDCSGQVGNGRFGLRCEDGDGMGDVDVAFVGKAVLLDNGKLALRKAQGRGFTEDGALVLGLKATEQ